VSFGDKHWFDIGASPREAGTRDEELRFAALSIQTELADHVLARSERIG